MHVFVYCLKLAGSVNHSLLAVTRNTSNQNPPFLSLTPPAVWAPWQQQSVNQTAFELQSMSRYLLGGLIRLDLNCICFEIWPIQRAVSIFIALVCLYVSVCARELKWAHLCASSQYFTVLVAISTQSYITTLAVGGCWFIAVKLSIKMALRFTHLLGHTWIAFLSFSLFLLHYFAFLGHTQTQTLKCTHTHAFCSNSCVRSCMSFA